MTSSFAFLSMLAHATVLLCYAQYVADLRRGLNRFRWFEYALSSSVMIALIAMLFGIYDVLSLVSAGGAEVAHARTRRTPCGNSDGMPSCLLLRPQVLIMSVNATMCLFGLLHETTNQKTDTVDWSESLSAAAAPAPVHKRAPLDRNKYMSSCVCSRHSAVCVRLLRWGGSVGGESCAYSLFVRRMPSSEVVTSTSPPSPPLLRHTR